MPVDIGLQSSVQRCKEVPFSRLDDELLAIDPDAGAVHSLNPTAARVWELIASPATVEELCVRLGEEYEVDAATCRREVLTLLRALAEAGLVTTR